MIEKLQNIDLEIAIQMKTVFQLSYAVEAKLLKAIDFPPLKRRIESYLESTNVFFGYRIKQELTGIIELKNEKNFTLIQSLVVSPKFFRKGIAKNLMEYVLSEIDDKPFVVETGVKNLPATNLYEKFNFKEIKQWETDHGVRKIRFERKLVH